MKTEMLLPGQIRTDGGTQIRAKLDYETVGEYADGMRRGEKFPCIYVFYDGTDYWLADGFHRLAAHAQANGSIVTIAANVRAGTRRDAVLEAAGANAMHGLRRQPADRERAVLALLNDEEWRGWSDREIARRCHVSHPFVGKLRGQQFHTGNDSSIRMFIHVKSGLPTQMRTAKIGGGVDVQQELNEAAVVWLWDYEDRHGRGWSDLSDNQTYHGSSPCYDAFVKAHPGEGLDYTIALKKARVRLLASEEKKEKEEEGQGQGERPLAQDDLTTGEKYTAIWQLEINIWGWLREAGFVDAGKKLCVGGRDDILSEALRFYRGHPAESWMAQPWKKNDVVQAFNNVRNQLRVQEEQRLAKEEGTVTQETKSVAVLDELNDILRRLDGHLTNKSLGIGVVGPLAAAWLEIDKARKAFLIVSG